MTRRAAIILAGGKARRFQTAPDKWQDKALAALYGKPLLVHTIENIRDFVDEIVLVANENEKRRVNYVKVLEEYQIKDIRITPDLKINNLSGPMIAILTGLTYSTADYCISIPADMPLVNGKVAEYMFNQIKGSYVAVPMWPNGRLETLLMVLERKSILKIADVLCRLGRSHPDDIIRGAMRVLFVSPLGQIKALDPELKSFVNINSQQDLSQLHPRQVQGSLVEDLRVNLGSVSFEELPLLLKASFERNNSNFFEAARIFANCASNFEKQDSFFWAAVSRENEAKSCLRIAHSKEVKGTFLHAARDYGSEAELYKKNKCYLLADRASSDKLWCESKA